jgi:IS5 family transposase
MGRLGFFRRAESAFGVIEGGRSVGGNRGAGSVRSFRAAAEAVVLTPQEAKKSRAGRKPLNTLALFRILILQVLLKLSDEQIGYQVRDRLLFMRVLDLGFEDGIPDGTTLWLCREQLAQAGLIDKLFEQFDRHLNAKSFIARGGQMVDASVVLAPKQREENEADQHGETPTEWEEKPDKNPQKYRDACWTRKHGKNISGYKNHVNVERRPQLIRCYAVSGFVLHDSRQLDGLARQGNTSEDAFGDSGYRSAGTEVRLKAHVFWESHLCTCVRAPRGHSLLKVKAAANRAKSRIRARIEHMFRAQERRAASCAPSETSGHALTSVYKTSPTPFAVTLERMAAI